MSFLTLRFEVNLFNYFSAVDRELKQLDDKLIKLLAYQRIQHLLSQNDTNNQSLATLITNSVQISKPFRHMPLPSELLTPADIDRISRVFTSPKKSKITRCGVRNGPIVENDGCFLLFLQVTIEKPAAGESDAVPGRFETLLQRSNVGGGSGECSSRCELHGIPADGQRSVSGGHRDAVPLHDYRTWFNERHRAGAIRAL